MGAGPQIVAKFVADTTALTSGVDQAASKSGSRLDNFGKKAALAIGGAFAVSKIVDFGKAAIQAATDDAAAQATLAQTLKNVTGATDAQVAASEDYISSLSKQVAIADDDLRPAYDKLVRGFGDAEEAQKALALATDVSAGTGKDLSAVTEAMMKAAMGNTGALKKMGVEVKNADGSAKSLDEIMASMSKTFQGQAATAADTTAGRMKNASIQFGEFQEQLGTAVLPLVSSFASILTTYVIPALSGLASFVQDNIKWVGPLAVALGVATVAIWAMNAALAANPISLVVIAIAALVAGIIAAYQNCEIFRTIVDTAFKAIATAFGWITDAAEKVFDWIKSNWPLLLAIITGPIGVATLAVIRNWDTIKDAATAVWQWVVDKWNAITAGISSAVSAIGGFMSTVVGFLRTPIDAAREMYDGVKGFFDDLVSAISGIVGSISSTVGRVVSAITDPINAVINGWNGLAFTLPKIDIPKVSIPGIGDIGGGSFGGQRFDFPNIRPLATGAVFTRPTLLAGEAGTEIVTPEALMRRIIREEGGGASYTLNMYPRTADASDIAYGFRRLELLAGVA